MNDCSATKSRSPLNSPESNSSSSRTQTCATSLPTQSREPTPTQKPTSSPTDQPAEQKVHLPQLPHPSTTSPWSWLPMSPSFYASSPLYYPASGVRYSTPAPVFPSHQAPSCTQPSADSRSWASVSPSRRPRWLNHHLGSVPHSPNSHPSRPVSRPCQPRSRRSLQFSPYQRPSTAQQGLTSFPRRRHQHNMTLTPLQPLSTPSQNPYTPPCLDIHNLAVRNPQPMSSTRLRPRERLLSSLPDSQFTTNEK
jgi:hypothetical protein